MMLSYFPLWANLTLVFTNSKSSLLKKKIVDVLDYQKLL